MENSTLKKISSDLKFVYSDDNSISVIFQKNTLLRGIVGEFDKNLKELEKLTKTNIYFRGNSILIKSDPKKNEIVNEDYKLNPTSFARQYHIAESPWYESQGKENFTTIMLRLPWVVGNGSWFTGSYINYAINHGYVPLYGDGSNWMSLIDVHDCCSLALHLSKQSKLFKIVNLCDW